jgi:hypothetical protein
MLVLALVFFAIAFSDLPRGVRAVASAVVVLGILFVMAMRPDQGGQ